MNPLCECPLAGYCERHKVTKSPREYDLCRGNNCKPDQSKKYWTAWEQGILSGHAVNEPKEFREGLTLPATRISNVPRTAPQVASAGVGTELKKIIEWFKVITSACDLCNQRAAIMDQKGVEWCEQNIDLILEWLNEGARKRGIIGWIASKIPGFELGARQVVLTAIENAKKKSGQLIGIYDILNSKVPADAPAVETVDMSSPTRHLTFHLWPVKGNPVWRWHCDQLIQNSGVFNGRRIVSIATDDQSDDAETVKAYLSGFTDEFIVTTNNPQLREVATWVPMLSRLEQYQSASDITFSCHGKGVRRGEWSAEDQDPIFKWVDTMYQTCLHLPTAEQALVTNAMAGSFRREGPHTSRIWGPWHYSGTFFWWRNRDVFRRNWTFTPQSFFGVEAWPGFMFRHNESACLFADRTGNLYSSDFWRDEIEPQLKRRAECLGSKSAAEIETVEKAG